MLLLTLLGCTPNVGYEPSTPYLLTDTGDTGEVDSTLCLDADVDDGISDNDTIETATSLGIMRRPGAIRTVEGSLQDPDVYLFEGEAGVRYRVHLDTFIAQASVSLIPYPFAEAEDRAQGEAPLFLDGGDGGYHPWVVVVQPILTPQGFVPTCTPYTLTVESYE